MTHTIVIDGRFPSLNEYIAALSVRRGSWIKGREMKREALERICPILEKRFKGGDVKCPVLIRYRFFEESSRRDLDNICGFFHKVFQDALVESGVLPDDGWHEIVGFEDHFFIDKTRPRIEIEIDEVNK